MNAVIYGKIVWGSEEWQSMIVIIELECNGFGPGSCKRARLVLHVMKSLDSVNLGAMCTYKSARG